MSQDALHALVHSLSASERRYVRLYGPPGGASEGSNYKRLLEALLAQPVYDEQALRMEFEGEPVARHLSSEKNYLYRHILRCLRAMREERDARAQLRACVDDAVILFERGLYAPSRKLLARARKLAEESEQFTTLLEIIVWERRLWKIMQDKGRGAIADALISGHAEILQRLQTTFAYYDLYDRMYLMVHQKFSLRKPLEEPAWMALLQDPLLQDHTHATSFEARHFYLWCQVWRHQMAGDLEQMYAVLQECISLWEANPRILAQETTRYTLALSNLLHAAGASFRYEEFPSIFAKIKAQQLVSRHGDLQLRHTLLYYELLYHLNQADWDAAQLAARAAEDFLGTVGDQLPTARRIAFWYNLAVLAYVLEDFRAALRHINAILDTSGSELREDIQHFARILLLIIHSELGHWDILDGLHRSAYRYLFSRGELHAYERLLLDALRRLAADPQSQAQQVVLRGLRANLDDAKLGNRPGMEELYGWIDSRLQGRPLRVVIAERLAADRKDRPIR